MANASGSHVSNVNVHARNAASEPAAHLFAPSANRSKLSPPGGNMKGKDQLVLGELLVDESPDALFALSIDGRVLSWNRGAESIFGFSSKEVLGQKLDELIVPRELRGQTQQTLAKMVEKGSILVEAERVRKDGSSIYVDISMRRVRS